MDHWIVDQARATQLNLRAAPAPARVIAVLDAGTPLRKLGTHRDDPRWWRVVARLSGAEVQGWVHGGYLCRQADDQPVDVSALPACALPARRGDRRVAGLWAFSLAPQGLVRRDTPDAARTLAIIGWLAPDNPAHRRYQPQGNSTFCNIYAHDFCDCMGCYLPRVWWNDRALAGLAQGLAIAPQWGRTVAEMTANRLHGWPAIMRPRLGWRRVFDAGQVQQAANAGQVAVIVARNRIASRSGHIAAVAPEHQRRTAARSGGAVLRPVQSQAGRVNHSLHVPARQWWRDPRFDSFALWIHP